VSGALNKTPVGESAETRGGVDGFNSKAPRTMASKLHALSTLRRTYAVVRRPDLTDFRGKFGIKIGTRAFGSTKALDFEPNRVNELTSGNPCAVSMLGFEQLEGAKDQLLVDTQPNRHLQAHST
jgi:hypothetical protein